MSSSLGLVESSLTPALSFNWVFLVELLVCGIVTLFFLFYFNRIFATLVSYGIRAWTWHQYRVYVDIQALQISLLGGRIFFKGIRYHGNNETILLQSGFVTWTYWLRKVRELDISHRPEFTNKRVPSNSTGNSVPGSQHGDVGAAEQGGAGVPPKLPCRLNVNIQGAEWFIYNRSAAYDALMAGLLQKDDDITKVGGDQTQLDDGPGLKRRFGFKDSEKEIDFSGVNSRDRGKLSDSAGLTDKDMKFGSLEGPDHGDSSTTQGNEKGGYAQISDADSGKVFLQFLPIHLECAKAAIVMGNENTKSVLIAKFDQASGDIDASSCRAPDRYRQLFNFQLKHPVIQIKPNDDYKEAQSETASRIIYGSKTDSATAHLVHHHSLVHRYRRKIYHKMRNLVPYFRRSVESFSSITTDAGPPADPLGHERNDRQWQGLSRYLDDNEQDEKSRWSTIEYATVSTIVDSPEATMTYYWDIPGIVPASTGFSTTRSNGERLDINGDRSPEWGLDLIIRGAMVNYGPWADRQRADLQRVFFPNLCKDTEPAKTLKPGQTRVASKFKLYLQLDDETTLRVPIREESKNWKWKRRADTMGRRSDEPKRRRGKYARKKKSDKGNPGPEARPFGWLDIKVGANATITYAMDMVAGFSGFSNKLEIDIPSMEITTSVNHGLLWRSVDQRLSCDLSNPLGWNDLHMWKFDISSNGLELFILREHIFLLIDLVDDWATGPPPEYLTFTPFRYMLNLQFENFRLYLNANDSNIINNPSDFDDNTFIIIFGTALTAEICVPLDKFRPHRNDISFNAKAHTGGLNLHVPPWNTQATFLAATELANLKNLDIEGTYSYCATTSVSNTDTLVLDLSGRNLETQIFGFLVRYLIKLKDNYFGEDIRFKTLEEYQQILQATTDTQDVEQSKPPHKKSNDLDVILGINVSVISAHLPANLYSAQKNVHIETPDLFLDLRFTNYYMDLDFYLSPLVLSLGTDEVATPRPESAARGSELFIDGVGIYGHRVFGLPPTEPTYVCNWDFKVGSVTGECSTDFLAQLIAGAKAFVFSFEDDENALPPIHVSPLHDITFLRAAIEPIRIWLHVEDSAFMLSTGAVEMNLHDWAGFYYSKKLRLEVPDLRLACVDAESASRHRSRTTHPVETHAYFQTDVKIATIDRKLGFAEDRRLQQHHVRREDLRTHRADFLLRANLVGEISGGTPVVESPAMSFPPLPVPLQLSVTLDDDRSSRGEQRIQQKSSFLSISSSSQRSQKSILRSHSKMSISHKRNHFATKSRSPSRRAHARLSQATQIRGVSASTGRRSSFYSAIGDHSERRGMPASSVSFTSLYVAPYFPLEFVDPDPKNLPAIGITENDVLDPKLDIPGNGGIDQRLLDDEETHTSFIVEFGKGIRAYCTPDAIHALTSLLTAIQPAEPVDLIDSLHIDSVSDVFALNKQNLLKAKSADLHVRIPAVEIRFANPGPSKTFIHHGEVDQYDVSVSGLAATARIAFAATHDLSPADRKPSSSMHVKVKSAGISAKERLGDVANPQAAISGALEEIVFWVSSSDVVSAGLNLKAVDLGTTSSKLEYLASLLHRTTVLGSDISEAFGALTMQQRNRIQLFTFLVVTAGQRARDPLFMTRPSYVLRSAAGHLRVSDTWKVITRLRHMYNSLERTTQMDIITRAVSNTENCPDAASQRVLAEFDHWRSWDLSNLSDCVVMRKVYGPLGHELPKKKPTDKPMRIAIALERVGVVIDPGPKQSEIILTSFIVETSAEILKANEIDPSSSSGLLPIRDINIQVYCKDVSIDLNWELCDLAENIMKLYSENQPDAAKRKIVSGQTSSPDKPNQVHVVVVTEKGSITLDAINVRAVSMTDRLTASFVMVEGPDGKESKGSIMIVTEAATSKIRSHFQELAIFQLRHPSVYVAFESQKREGSSENSFKVAANCKELSFIAKQDVLGLLEVIDVLIGDEVNQIYGLVAVFQNNWPQQVGGVPKQHRVQNRVNVALFLDMYHISMPLLHSLTYNVSGTVARASVAAIRDSHMVFDFDIKENSHDVQMLVENKARSISLLQMPPTNGRITSHLGAAEMIVSIFASVERVNFDAAAIHSLLTALNRPEILNVINEARANLRRMQNHLDETFGHKKPPTSKLSSDAARPIIFDLHLNFAGLHAYANTERSPTGQDNAQLSFTLEYVQLEASNRLEQNGPALEYPEIHLNLKSVMCELTRLNGDKMEPCGNFVFAAEITATSKKLGQNHNIRSYHVKSEISEISVFAETASTVVDVLAHFQERIKDLDLSKEVSYLQRLRKPNPRITIQDELQELTKSTSGSTSLFDSMYSLELLNIQISWIVSTSRSDNLAKEKENLILSCKRIDLSTKRENSAKLTIENLQLQIAPRSRDRSQRSQNSALLPEVIFNVAYVSTAETRRLAFQAAGKSLDLRLTSQFMIPTIEIKKSIESASEKVRAAAAIWSGPPSSDDGQSDTKRKTFFGTKRMESLLIDADFAGAMVHLQGKKAVDASGSNLGGQAGRKPHSGRYGQFSQEDPSSNTVLRAPGLAWKVEFRDKGTDDPSFNAEIKISASSNILYPTVVPLIMEISSSVKEIVSDEDDPTRQQPRPTVQKLKGAEEDNIFTADPSAVLGRTRLNLGLRICTQEFSLSCQPIARVAATARFDDIYLTVNTLRSLEHGHFFAVSAAITRFQASVQHVYSRESTGSFDVDSVVLSMMNSKHVSGTSGISAILKISPMKVLVNAKQLQDFLLFREIWVPPEIREAPASHLPTTPQAQSFSIQRYQEVAATGAFPWNATISIAELNVQLDLGQAIGKSAFIITNFWISSRKNSDWEQNLCLGFEKVGVDSTGRMSGFVSMEDFRLRTSIAWPEREKALNQTPLIQGSLGFSKFRVKAAFDYQVFLVGDVTSFEFMMYNVRSGPNAIGDRLVAVLDGESVQVFCTTATASQGLALYQAMVRLVQEKRSNYEASLNEIERFMQRKSTVNPQTLDVIPSEIAEEQKEPKSPISLHTDVVVTLKAVTLGVFPSTFFDHQVFKLEALDAQARFSVAMKNSKIHSGLGLTLGHLRIGLAGVKRPPAQKVSGDISVEEIVDSATGSHGGTILRVPKVEATMETWQVPDSNHIDYIFKSSLEGKVEVGWNYSRISFIRTMYSNHSKALAQRLGKPLPPSAVKITGVPGEENKEPREEGERQKIIAEVTVPQSKYEYVALEPPIIETPKLRDMGEATPPLEWIGLHRDRLPNLMHQIVIVSLLELASEVEDAYERILGSS